MEDAPSLDAGVDGLCYDRRDLRMVSEITICLRQCMVVFIGVMLGSQFTPDLLDRLSSWTFSVTAMVGYIIISMLCVLFYLYKFANYDPITSYFSAAPGGLNDMTIIGGEMGGDDRTIALTQASRVLFVVLTIPCLLYTSDAADE